MPIDPTDCHTLGQIEEERFLRCCCCKGKGKRATHCQRRGKCLSGPWWDTWQHLGEPPWNGPLCLHQTHHEKKASQGLFNSQRTWLCICGCVPPPWKHTRLVVQEADGAVLVRSDGDGLRRVADHAVDQLAACGAEVGGKKTSSTQTCLPGSSTAEFFNSSDSRRGRTVLGLRLQRRDALLRVQVVEQRLAAVERHHHLVGVGGHESHWGGRAVLWRDGGGRAAGKVERWGVTSYT